MNWADRDGAIDMLQRIRDGRGMGSTIARIMLEKVAGEVVFTDTLCRGTQQLINWIEEQRGDDWWKI